MTATATIPTLALYVSANGGYNWVKVSFSGEQADEMAADFVNRKQYLVHDEASFFAREDAADFPLTVAALAPSCEHGMSKSLCHGPDHFPSAEWERIQWGEW